MSVRPPHFILLSQARRRPTNHDSAVAQREESADTAGEWQFSIRTPDGAETFGVRDTEPVASRDRLDLLAVTRGLEALDQPSRVTLVTASGYVHRGIRFGLSIWRDNNWQWERYGRLVPIKNRDLWQRIDRALEIHQVECRFVRIDRAHDDLSPRSNLIAQAVCATDDVAAKSSETAAAWSNRSHPAQKQPAPALGGWFRRLGLRRGGSRLAAAT